MGDGGDVVTRHLGSVRARDAAAAFTSAFGASQVWTFEDCTATRPSVVGFGARLRVVFRRDTTLVGGDEELAAAARAVVRGRGPVDLWSAMDDILSAREVARVVRVLPALFHAAYEATHEAERIDYHRRSAPDDALAELVVPSGALEVAPDGTGKLASTARLLDHVLATLSTSAAGSLPTSTPGLLSSSVTTAIGPSDAAPPPDLARTAPPDDYAAAIEACLRHIAVGDAYQIVLGYGFERTGRVDPVALYRRLVEADPAPYGFCWPITGATLVGASPECLARSDGVTMSLRPLAGTIARTHDPAVDEAALTAFAADAKELGEHLMLLDLCRDDLAKGCETRSVEVIEEFAIETYANVFHLASEVTGLRRAQDAFAAIRDVFPAGTMTGAPRLRAMEIINHLESTPRGPYAGAVGYVRGDGRFDSAICIRMVEVRPSGCRLRAAGGVLAESTTMQEWSEIEAKLAGCSAAVAAEAGS